MGASKLLGLALAGAAVAAVETSPAGGQCRLCDAPTTSPAPAADSQQVSLEIETSLDFDRLILFDESGGSVLLRPDGSRAVEGALGDVGARAMVGSAVVRGAPGRTVRVELPRRIELYSLSGGTIAFEDVESDLPSLPRLDAAGQLTFRFGGRLRISGNAEGEYRGDLPITVEYQ